MDDEQLDSIPNLLHAVHSHSAAAAKSLAIQGQLQAYADLLQSPQGQDVGLPTFRVLVGVEDPADGEMTSEQVDLPLSALPPELQLVAARLLTFLAERQLQLSSRSIAAMRQAMTTIDTKLQINGSGPQS